MTSARVPASARASAVRAISPSTSLVGPDVLAALAAAFVVLAPFIRLRPYAGLHDSQRIAEVVILGLALIAACTPSGVRALRVGLVRLPAAARIGLATAVALGLASSVFAAESLYAAAEVGMVVVLVGLALTLAGHWASGRTDLRPVAEGLAVVCAAIYAGVVFYRHGLAVSDGGPGWPSAISGPFAGARSLGQLQILYLPVLLGLATRLPGLVARPVRREVARWGLRLLLTANVAIAIQSGGRGLLLSLAVASVAGLVLAPPRDRQALLIEGTLAVGLGLALHALAFSAVAEGFDRGGDVMSGRAMHWSGAVWMVADRPLLGLGPMHYAYVQTTYGAHPHNIVLQLAAEWGLPATLLLVGIAGWGTGAVVRGAWSAPESGRRTWMALLAAVLLGSLASGLFDSFAMLPGAQMWGLLFLAVLLAETSHGIPTERTEVPGRASVRWRLGVALAAIAAFAPLATVVAQDAPMLRRRIYDRRTWLHPLTLYPRFWQVGTIAPPQGSPPELRARYWPGIPESTWIGVVPAHATDRP